MVKLVRPGCKLISLAKKHRIAAVEYAGNVIDRLRAEDFGEPIPIEERGCAARNIVSVHRGNDTQLNIGDCELC